MQQPQWHLGVGLVAIGALVAAACNRAPDPATATASCEEAAPIIASRLAAVIATATPSSVPAGVPAAAVERATLDAVVAQCHTDAWSPAVLGCAKSTKTGREAQACLARLPVTQQRGLGTAIAARIQALKP